MVALVLILALGLLGGCSGADPQKTEVGETNSQEDLGHDEDASFERPDKNDLGRGTHCETWRTDLAPHFEPAPWGLPDTGEVSENVRGFFAAQFPVEGKDYMGCVLHDIFGEIELNIDEISRAYFEMPPEAQLARSQVGTFLSFLYEEEYVVELLVDIAVQPTPTFDSRYVEEFGEASVRESEAQVRNSAVNAIQRTAPFDSSLRHPWTEGLFTFVIEAEAEYLAEKLVAMWFLRNFGVPKDAFVNRVSEHLSEDDLGFLLEQW
ncbi:hypothetical protein FRD01_22950 [Microvenator marinus]|uniref:Uncharacterized protein n=1 Tax=Microvenator marinus TaxID=2600177 RepID=A0A5B8Y314_9DELT|nr:hypothetical protein [Microvenator marinus]QED30039.1 hypothetical protein FRD01_22950 [Microvenator marinus]